MKQLILSLLCAALLISGCQAAPAVKLAPTSLPMSTIRPLPEEKSDPEITVSPTNQPVEPSTLTPTPDLAFLVVKDYLEAVRNQDYQKAAAFLSNYSLMVEEITPNEAADQIKISMQETKWEGFAIMETSQYDEKTVLVHTWYETRIQEPDSNTSRLVRKHEYIPLRMENHRWRVNYKNLLDYHTLEVNEQTRNGLTIKPRLLAQYSDRVRLVLLVQNRSNEPIVLGQPNEVMAAFLYGAERVEAKQTRFIFDRLRSYPDVIIELEQPAGPYPDGIVIRQWKNYDVEPWFTFQFNQ